MNILILNWRDIQHPLAGGAEVSLLEHAKYWQKEGVKITWFASDFPGAKKEELIDGMTIIRAGSHFTTVLFAFYYYLAGKFGKQDIVVDCFHFIPFFTPLYMWRKKKIALINEVAGKVWFSNLPLILAIIGYYTEPFFFMFYKSMPFITASDSAREDLIKVGVSPQKIDIVHHGVSLEKVNEKISKEKEPTLLFLNRISKDKGIDDVLDAYSRLKRDDHKMKLWLVGKEEIPGELGKMLKRKGLQLNSDGLIYFGFVDQKKKFELLKKAWILVHPSKKEGWGLTVIEAASQGTPTVGYNVEGLKDSIQHMKTGILVDENPDALADGIKMLLSDEKLRKRLGETALGWSNEFDWKKSGEKSWRLLENLDMKERRE